MDLPTALAKLEGCGSEQTRRTYRRHGVTGELFGVSYADLKTLKKAIKTDQALAEGLWSSGNHDARVPATMVADPKTIGRDVLEAWAGDLENDVQAGALAGLVAATPHAAGLRTAWRDADQEWLGSAGWTVLALLASKDHLALTDDACMEALDAIRTTIHDRPNRVRYAMNNALIALGLCSPEFQARALEVARAIGKVQVDHGETDCKTPDAAAYILKAAARRR